MHIWATQINLFPEPERFPVARISAPHAVPAALCCRQRSLPARENHGRVPAKGWEVPCGLLARFRLPRKS